MCYIIFLVSVIGICLICFTVDNYYSIYPYLGDKKRVEIILTKYYVDNVEKKDIVLKIKSGNYDNILDVVDNITIN